MANSFAILATGNQPPRRGWSRVTAAPVPFWLSAYLLGILTAAYYFGVFAMAWDLLFGFAGEVNFGPTFLIGLGVLLTRAETLTTLRIGETTLHWLARTKKLNAIKIGARVLFSAAEVERTRNTRMQPD